MSLDICILDAGYGVVDVYVIKRAERSEVRGFLPKKIIDKRVPGQTPNCQVL